MCYGGTPHTTVVKPIPQKPNALYTQIHLDNLLKIDFITIQGVRQITRALSMYSGRK